MPLLRLAMPLIAGELGWMLMSVIDTVVVGRLPNSAVAISAAALAQVIFNTFTFGVSGILLGLDTLISQAFGAKEIGEANRWLWHGLTLAVALAALLIGVFEAGPMLIARMPIDHAVLAQAIPAMRGLNYGVLPLMLYFTLRRYLQAGHHTKAIAFALISANVLNFAGDWLLAFGHRWIVAGRELAIPAFGVVGSSWSTSFARVYMFLVLLLALRSANRKHGYGIGKASRRIEWQHMRQLLAIGTPAGATIFVEIAIFATVTSLIGTLGPLPLAGHEIALQCAGATFMVPFAISAATSVRVGHAIGRVRAGIGNVTEAAAAGWCGILAGATFMLMTSLVLATAPAKIARIFTPDAGVIGAAVPLLMVAAAFQFFDGIQITATGALRGAGQTTAPLYTHLCCYWVVGLPIGLWLGFHLHYGAVGLWVGLLTGLVGAAVVLTSVWGRVSRASSDPVVATGL